MGKQWKIYCSEQIDESFSLSKINRLQMAFIQQCIINKQGFELDHVDRASSSSLLIKIIPINIVEQLLENMVDLGEEWVPWFTEIRETAERNKIYFKFHPEVLKHLKAELE